jgi:hypothetical protein
MDNRIIRIVDGEYNTKLLVDEGSFIRVNGKLHRVHYVDDYNFKIDNAYWHISQFGKNVIDAGCSVEKIEASDGADVPERKREYVAEGNPFF